MAEASIGLHPTSIIAAAAKNHFDDRLAHAEADRVHTEADRVHAEADRVHADPARGPVITQ